MTLRFLHASGPFVVLLLLPLWRGRVAMLLTDARIRRLDWRLQCQQLQHLQNEADHLVTRKKFRPAVCGP